MSVLLVPFKSWLLQVNADTDSRLRRDDIFTKSIIAEESCKTAGIPADYPPSIEQT
jgi:hypothetical protein